MNIRKLLVLSSVSLMLSGCASEQPTTEVEQPVDETVLVTPTPADSKAIGQLTAHSRLIADLTSEGWGSYPKDSVKGSFEMTKVGDITIFGIVFDVLPENVGDLYGWIVRKNPVGIIKMGKVSMRDGKMSLYFGTNTDVSTFDFVVITGPGEDQLIGPVYAIHALK